MPRPTPGSTVHLLCNSHLDPVWLWEWPEGAGEALGLARTVCDLCEEFDGFVFNRNEVQFYEWIEEYDPALFQRIAKLVASGQWHVMGGWYLQPDCNLPTGESFVRQILVGRRYFKAKFGVEPSTAANVDSFGHSRGLVQILAKSGYDSYLFCRPKLAVGPYPATEFTWVGFDGSELTAAVAEPHYNSPTGEGAEKVREWLGQDPGKPVRQVPWGVGNHGGGPSRKDLGDIGKLMAEIQSPRILHSTPEQFFAEVKAKSGPLPRHPGDLNPFAVGCYTSAMRLKRQHRRLENELFLTEKMATTAWAQGLMEYPGEELAAATRSLLTNQFHDILGGTSIPSGEETAVEELGHGLTLTSRVKARAFFALTSGQKAGREGSHPILVYNPHPFPLRTLVECEVQPAWPDREHEYGIPFVRGAGKGLPAQAEQQESNINEDHRKRVVFRATLKPGQMNRFDCRLEKVGKKPPPESRIRDGKLHFKTDDIEVVINSRTGLLDRFRIHGKDYLAPGAARPLVMADNADPWGMTVKSFRQPAGCFQLMSQAEAAQFSGTIKTKLPAVRVIEDGPIRTVVEALFSFGKSAICQRYRLPRAGTEVELEVRVLWQEKDSMLKLALPTPWKAGTLLGQVAYGAQKLPDTGNEVVGQKWLAVTPRRGSRTLSVINDSTYGCDFLGGELRLSLLRGPAHAGHPTGTGRPILHQDRFTPRMDQGEHIFRFWLNGGPNRDRLTSVDREAIAKNEQPYALAYWPPGSGELPKAGPVLSDRAVQVTAFKKSEEGDDLVVRLFEPTGRPRKTTLSLDSEGLKTPIKMGAFEIKTLRVDRRTGRTCEVSLLEEY
jgi:alpha-mannosidase